MPRSVQRYPRQQAGQRRQVGQLVEAIHQIDQLIAHLGGDDGCCHRAELALEAGLALIKLRLGVGRDRRGEVVSGGLFVRTWAVQHLVRALRGRLLDPDEPLRDILEPTRRLERVLPRL